MVTPAKSLLEDALSHVRNSNQELFKAKELLDNFDKQPDISNYIKRKVGRFQRLIESSGNDISFVSVRLQKFIEEEPTLNM